MGRGLSGFPYLYLSTLLSTFFVEQVSAQHCTPAGSTPVCSWTTICVPEHKPGIPPPRDPKDPPPLPGYEVSCNNDVTPENDWNHNCIGGIDIEIKKCELFLGGDGEGNRIVFTMKNHSRILTHTSKSARWGHLGINPTVPTQTANDPDLPANPDRDDQADFEKYYTRYTPDNAMSESLPNPIVMPPLSIKEFEHSFISDFPPIKGCGDVVYLYVTQEGIVEPPHLWNRNYACGIEPCFQRNFRRCKVNRGGGKKSESLLSGQVQKQ